MLSAFSFTCQLVCTSASALFALQLSALFVCSISFQLCQFSAFAFLNLICILFLDINDVYSLDVFPLKRIKSPRLLFYPQEDLSSFLPFTPLPHFRSHHKLQTCHPAAHVPRRAEPSVQNGRGLSALLDCTLLCFFLLFFLLSHFNFSFVRRFQGSRR